jgi:signal transduction histidine kinase
LAQPHILESALTCLSAAATALYVASRRQRGPTHWLVLAVLGSVVLWSGGIALRRTFPEAPASPLFTTIAFLGVFALPPFWLLLAARFTRVELFEERPALRFAIAVPSALSFLALLTNPGHRLFIRDLSVQSLSRGPLYYGGPLFWPATIWGYSLVMVGVVLYLASALRLVANKERARGVGLAVAALVPLISSLSYTAALTPRDLTPAALGFSVLLLFGLIWRYQVLETLPIARRDMIEHLPDAVVIADRAGRVLDLNPAAAALFGAPAAELRRADLAEALSDLARSAAGDPGLALGDALASLVAGGPPFLQELPCREGRVLELEGACVRTGDGQPAGVYVILRDRTEQRRFERFVRQGQRLETVAGLAAGLAHEVRNPLAYVRANLSHVERALEEMALVGEEKTSEPKPAEWEELRLVVTETVEGVDRIGRIVERIRRFARIQEGELGDVDLERVAGDAVKIAGLHHAGAGQVELDLDPAARRVRGSADHLVQALVNLIVNARQAVAGHPDGRVRVETRALERHLEIRVRDNGPGVPQALRERIFDPFFTTRSPRDGTGLGLAISFDIAREHGGSLEHRAPEEGGSEFAICLPALPSC